MTVFYFLTVFFLVCLAFCVWRLIRFLRERSEPLSRKPTGHGLHARYCIIGNSGLHIGEEDILMRDDAITLFKDILHVCNSSMNRLRDPKTSYSYNILIRVSDGVMLGSVALHVNMGVCSRSGWRFRASPHFSICITSAKDAATKWLEQFIHAEVYDSDLFSPQKPRAMWVHWEGEWILVSYKEWKASKDYREYASKPAVTYREALAYSIKLACMDHMQCDSTENHEPATITE